MGTGTSEAETLVAPQLVVAGGVYNAARAQEAAGRMVAQAKAALQQQGIPPLLRKALQMRVGYPSLSLTELAGLAGLTKDTLANRIRRGLRQAERMRAMAGSS